MVEKSVNTVDIRLEKLQGISRDYEPICEWQHNIYQICYFPYPDMLPGYSKGKLATITPVYAEDGRISTININLVAHEKNSKKVLDFPWMFPDNLKKSIGVN